MSIQNEKKKIYLSFEKFAIEKKSNGYDKVYFKKL